MENEQKNKVVVANFFESDEEFINDRGTNKARPIYSGSIAAAQIKPGQFILARLIVLIRFNAIKLRL